MEYKIKRHDKFEIKKGTVIYLHKEDNNIEGLEVGSIIILEDETKYEVLELEKYKASFCESKYFGCLVKQI